MGTGQKRSVGTGEREARRWVGGEATPGGFKESMIPRSSGRLRVTERAGVLPVIPVDSTKGKQQPYQFLSKSGATFSAAPRVLTGWPQADLQLLRWPIREGRDEGPKGLNHNEAKSQSFFFFFF